MICAKLFSRCNKVLQQCSLRMLILINALKNVCAAAHARSCGNHYVYSPCRVTP